MTYRITLKKSAIKALENIPEPNYSNIKSAIYNWRTIPVQKVIRNKRQRQFQDPRWQL